MCGRYTLTTPPDELLAIFGVPEVGFEHRPRYNIAPTQHAPILARDEDSGGLKMGLLRWGLIPFWAEDPGIGNKLINARSETASSKPSFRAAFARRRCLVPADGFYEWKKERDGKVPHWIHAPDGEPFTFAGLWERWEPGEGDPLHTYTILTRDAVSALEPIHPRMPVVLEARRRSRWLDPDATVDELDALLEPPPDLPWAHHPVSTVVNSPRNDVPECVEPVTGG